MMKSLPTFGGKGGALGYADELVKDPSKGLQVTALTPGQARDTLAALERLQAFYQSTGRRVSWLASVSEWAKAEAKKWFGVKSAKVERIIPLPAASRNEAH